MLCRFTSTTKELRDASLDFRLPDDIELTPKRRMTDSILRCAFYLNININFDDTHRLSLTSTCIRWCAANDDVYCSFCWSFSSSFSSLESLFGVALLKGTESVSA